MGILSKIKSVFSKKAEFEQVQKKPEQKIFSIPMGHSDYTDIMMEAMCCPYSEGYEKEENEEITRLLRLAAKTKNNRIKRKLYKRVEKEEQKNEI